MIGKTISSYKILEKLGAGGMGVVYKSRDLKLDRIVALKFLPAHLEQSEEEKSRFIHEAKTASSLDHPNICTIYDIDETDDHQTFICMACYSGNTLKDKIAKGPLTLDESIDIIIQAVRGISKAHKHGIVHRDIKPANIFITDDGIVKILDFGLAMLTGQEQLTKTGITLGTVAYMSPEQIQGLKVDNRTDIWSLGILLYEMLTSQITFTDKYEAALLYSIINESPVPPAELRREIPPELERITLKCLQKNPEDRYKNAQQLLTNLEKFKRSWEDKEFGAAPEPMKKPEPKKETERRQATVLFAEITGYTEMLPLMDAEEVASLISGCFAGFRSIHERYHGHIHGHTENTLTAFFGVPTAIEDAPKEAINAAIEMRNYLDEQDNLPLPIDIRIGINTGMVITGLAGMDENQDFTALGDTVTLASRLKEVAKAGQIIVGSLTHKYTRNEFEYRPLKPVSLIEKQKPIPVFELLSTREKIYRAVIGSDRKIYSEMVGREKELDILVLHVLKAINGEGSIVNVIGEAGIGKSRLISELQKRNELKRVTFLIGRALSIGSNLSYHPIIDLLKYWSGIKEDDSSSESLHKLEKTIRGVYPEGAEEIFPFVATLMGMKLSGTHADRIRGIGGESLEKLILKNLRDLIGKASEQQPVVIVIEDLHWADLTSIVFLESLYRLAENHRLLFINVFRSGYNDTSERIAQTIRHRYNNFSMEIGLGSLDENHAEILINNLLRIKGLTPKVRELIIKKTGGNPFFIEEVVRSLIDDGVVMITDGRFHVTDKIDSVIIPGTINEVLMARIDKLDEKTRSLLKIASVIGRNFFYRILADVAKTVEEIDDKLEYLKEVQLIIDRKRMAELEYLFKHAIAQEVTYESILIKKRKELHLKIANSIESVFSQRIHEFYGMLALHYSKGDDLDKAEEYLIKAGEEALKSSGSSEALNYYREALNIYLRKYGSATDPAKIAMLEKNIALALFNRGQYIEADIYFSKVLTYYGEKLPKHPVSVILKFSLGLLRFIIIIYFPFLKRNRVPLPKDSEIINLFYKKVTALILLDPTRMFIEVFYWIWRLINFDLNRIENGVGIISMSSASFSYGSISFPLSRKVLEFVKDIVDTSDPKSLLYYKLPVVILNTFSGNWDNIGEYDDDLVEQNVKIGELFYASGYVLIQGYSRIARGHYNQCLEFAQKLYNIASNYENDNAQSAYYWFKTHVLLQFRKLHEALSLSEKGIAFTNRTGFKPYMFSLCAFRARALILIGDMKEAEEILDQLKILKPEINLVPYFLSDYYISRLIFDIRRLEESLTGNNRIEQSQRRKTAFKTAKNAIKNANKIAADITEACKLMGLYYWLTGKQIKALKWWEKSIREGERLGARLELSRTFMEVGKRLMEKKNRFKELNGITGQQYLEKAETLFTEIDLQWDLEELASVKR